MMLLLPFYSPYPKSNRETFLHPRPLPAAPLPKKLRRPLHQVSLFAVLTRMLALGFSVRITGPRSLSTWVCFTLFYTTAVLRCHRPPPHPGTHSLPVFSALFLGSPVCLSPIFFLTNRQLLTEAHPLDHGLPIWYMFFPCVSLLPYPT